ncbi:MAG: hypothetical protein QOJ04_2559 [Caballeronia sp.]|nr:hypothetical protein [Caballeronia sp.]
MRRRRGRDAPQKIPSVSRAVNPVPREGVLRDNAKSKCQAVSKIEFGAPRDLRLSMSLCVIRSRYGVPSLGHRSSACAPIDLETGARYERRIGACQPGDKSRNIVA